MKIRVLANREKPRSQVLTRTFESDDLNLEERIEELKAAGYKLFPINPKTGRAILVRDLPSRPGRTDSIESQWGLEI